MSFLGSALGSVVGGLFGMANSSFSANKQLSNQLALMDHQHELNKQLFEYENSNKHQFEVSDLRNAGLNPILSATNGSAVGAGGTAPSAPTQDYASAFEKMFSAVTKAQIDNVNANTEKVKAQAAWENAKTQSFLANSASDYNFSLADYYGNESKRVQIENKFRVENILAGIGVKQAQAEAARGAAAAGYASAEASHTQAEKNRHDIAVINNNALKIAAELHLTKEKSDLLARINQYYRDNPNAFTIEKYSDQVGKIVGITTDIIKSIKPGFVIQDSYNRY